MGAWLHGRKYIILLAVLAIVAVAAVGVLKDRPFTPQASYETVVGGNPDSHRFDLSAGQTLGARFILSHSKDKNLSIGIASISERTSGAWHRDGLVRGYGEVGDCDVIWFEAPGTGHYAIEVASAGGERLNVKVEYCVLG